MQDHRTMIGAAALLSLGIAAAGWFGADALVRGRVADRHVTVKGVAEREVEADLAIWPMRFVVADDDLSRAQTELGGDADAVIGFLKRHGIESAEIELQELGVFDTQAQRYGAQQGGKRFVISQTLMVRSTRPSVVFAASQQVSELIDAGVVLSADGPWGGGPSYLFTGLNDLKPSMIAEATANAREAAAQFARDSRSRLGGIRRANQGLFVILPRDRAPGIQESQQRTKIVRVVSTVDYLLED
jgi:hypothetical protein